LTKNINFKPQPQSPVKTQTKKSEAATITQHRTNDTPSTHGFRKNSPYHNKPIKAIKLLILNEFNNNPLESMI
jgi:hypothetical protein